ncbi:site-specific integrase [Saccharopolyspora sp. NPDC002376]
MASNPNRGRVYRRCGCRDQDGQQLGPHCPKLAAGKHGTWAFAVDLPSITGRRRTLRRSGYDTRAHALAELNRVLACERSGVAIDDRQTVADYLTDWLATKTLTLKPTTIARYTDYIIKNLIPALGEIRLEKLSHQHVTEFVHAQLDAGRGPVTLRRCIATLSSALNDAVRQRRLTHNAAKYTVIPQPPKPQRICWTPAEAVRFLAHCADINDPLTELFEVLIGTGMRKGEALALHWADVHLDDRVLYVRHTLSNVNNTTPVFTTPKTKTSQDWVGLSCRVIKALQRQATRQHTQQLAAGLRWRDYGLVFTRADGHPLGAAQGLVDT